MKQREPCGRCGSKSFQPNGLVLHTFYLGESVKSTAGMQGVIIAGPVRHNGYKIRWENGYTGWSRVPDLEHTAELRLYGA